MSNVLTGLEPFLILSDFHQEGLKSISNSRQSFPPAFVNRWPSFLVVSPLSDPSSFFSTHLDNPIVSRVVGFSIPGLNFAPLALPTFLRIRGIASLHPFHPISLPVLRRRHSFPSVTLFNLVSHVPAPFSNLTIGGEVCVETLTSAALTTYLLPLRPFLFDNVINFSQTLSDLLAAETANSLIS